jgi:hypothetical protein
VFATKALAIEAVRKAVPPGWDVEGDAGEAPPDLVSKLDARPYQVIRVP